jgi:hypothetical protein
MITPQVLEYILQNIAAGLARADIEKSLLAAGWAAQDISDGFNTIERPKVSMPSQAASAPAQDDNAAETSRIQHELEQEAKRQKNASWYKGATISTPVVGSIIGWLIRKKIVEEESQANVALLGVAIIAIVLAIGIYIWSNNSTPSTPGPAAQELQTFKNLPGSSPTGSATLP